ncbi:MAG: cytochrome c biogenesis protein [Verrucomicrobiota bacterium]
MSVAISYLLIGIIALPVIVFLVLRPISRKPWRWPFAVVGVALFLLLIYPISLKPVQRDSGLDVEEFAETPVQFGGRLMPIDTVARTTLRILRGRESVPGPAGEKLEAVDWLLWNMAKPAEAAELPVFRIDHPEVISLFDLPEGEKYFSYAQLLPTLDGIDEIIGTLPEDSDDYTVYEEQLVKLLNGVQRYNRLVGSFHTGINRPDMDAIELMKIFRNWSEILRAAARNLARQQADAELSPEEQRFLQMLRTVMQTVQFLAEPQGRIAVVPPPDPEKATDETVAGERWKTIGGALLNAVQTGSTPDSVGYYADLILAYHEGDAGAFNAAVASLGEATADHAPQGRIQLEETFNRTSPFYAGSALYLAGLLLVFFGWFAALARREGFSEGFRQSAFWLLLLTFVLHSAALLARMIIMDRPAPVTNLYSSAVFIGWAACGLGLLLEQTYRNGFGNLIAAVVGFCTLIIAHGLDNTGDTMEAMRAVLDSNFWLSTHVVTITLGYTPMFVAGVLAIVYIVRGLFFKGFQPSAARTLVQMTYGLLAFALILTFIGTFLGGVWADQSWGRFWGWDPKENGALMIVLWVALIVHARVAGIVRERGLMNLTIVGAMITAWSWFGTNQLGIGLHSYGFTDAGHFWLMFFWTSQLVFIALGLVPAKYWRSADTLFRLAKTGDAGQKG